MINLILSDRFRAFFFLVVACLFSAPAMAVSLSTDGSGQALIFPVFSTAGGNDSLISILQHPESTRSPKAVKIRFIAGDDGRDLASFNVYLSTGDTWVAAISSKDGLTQVKSPDKSCTYPRPVEGVQAEFDAGIGYVEVIEMGIINDGDIDEFAYSFECESLTELWETGDWSSDPEFGLEPPTGQLRGDISIINVSKGTLYSTNAVALEGFSNIVQHTGESMLPNLSSVHDEGTAEGKTRSEVCDDGGCYEDFWENPIDAVSAVLTMQRLYGEFITAQSIRANSEWVVSYPTLRFDSTEFDPEEYVSLYVKDQEAQGVSSGPCVLTPDPFGCATSYFLDQSSPISILEFGNGEDDIGDNAVSRILGAEFTIEFPTDSQMPDAGSARLGFTWRTESELGNIYAGAPVIGVSFQEFTNGVLVGEGGQLQRANYGASSPLTAERRIE